MFICYARRAVHIETTNSMEADSFLIFSLRRFIPRQGNVFVGAKNELKGFYQMNH